MRGGFCPGREWPTDSVRLKLANEGGFGSSIVALALGGNRPEPRASWMGDFDGPPLVTCLEGVLAGLRKVYIYAYAYICA